MPRRNLTRWLLLFGLLLAIMLFYALGLEDYFSWDYVRANLDQWQATVRENLPLALLAYFLLYVAIAGLSLPVAGIITVLAGALFGRWLGTGVVSLGSTLGAVLAFLSSRYVFREWIERRMGHRLQALNEGVQRDGAYYLLTLRLVPFFPFFLVNLGMGLTRMGVATYAAVSMIGMLPGTFLYVNAGEALASVESPSQLLSTNVVVALALLGIVPLVTRRLLRRHP